jgi:hypothetical protein
MKRYVRLIDGQQDELGRIAFNFYAVSREGDAAHSRGFCQIRGAR